MPYYPLRPQAYRLLPVSWQTKFGRWGTRFYSTNKFGFNPSIGNSYEDIWDYGGNITFLSTAYTMNVVSSSSNDDGSPEGSGAHSIKIIGLDGNYDPIEEDIVLNGTNTVTTTNTFLRVYRAYITGAGSGETNAGNITISASTGGTVQGYITAGEGQTLMSIYTIRNGYYGLITGYNITVGVSDSAQVEIVTRSSTGVRRTRQLQNLGKGASFTAVFGDTCSPILISPKTDILMKAKRTTGGGGGGTAEVSASFIVWEIREEEINL